MKLGFGFYRHQLDREHLRFARQCGATHAVVHMVDYFRGGGPHNPPGDQPLGSPDQGWGLAGIDRKPWMLEELLGIKELLHSEGLEWTAIENLDPAHWHDVLLAGPRRDEQLETISEMIRTMGKAGIPVLGYNFSLAGVTNRIKTQRARGGAVSVSMEGGNDNPIPQGMVWNMTYDPDAPGGDQPACSSEELWARLKVFLDKVLPVAEEAGVTLAAHPDDPPLEGLRGMPRLVYQPNLYDRLISTNPSRASGLEFCLGTLAEMTEGDIYDTVEHFALQNRIAYIHFRNVRGKVPSYYEEFVDNGDIDMLRVIRILRRCDFQGVLIPDHTPQMSCAAPWHAGMAFAMGWMRAALQANP